MSGNIFTKYVRYSAVALYRIYYVFGKMLKGFPSINNLQADCLIWSYDFFTPRYFYSDLFINDMGIYAALKSKGHTVSVYTKRDIGRVTNRSIFINVDVKRNPYRFFNYVRFQQNLFELLEEQNNSVYCSSKEVAYWENKKFMYEQFHKLGIRTPPTQIYPIDEIQYEHIRYPVLVKEDHSCSSQGIHLISCREELDRLLSDLSFRERNRWLILQKMLSIHKDLRVILVGDEIVLAYWRINPNKEWKPTATIYGSYLDFSNFPTQWEEWIISQFKRSGLTTGAFDIAWENDDLNTEPYILELSPYYQPNPAPPPGFERLGLTYGQWKKSLTPAINYHAEFIKLVFTIKQRYIDYIFDQKHDERSQ